MWIKHYLGWMWLGIKLTFELSGGTEKMCFLHPAHLQTAQSFHFRLFPAAGICYIGHLSYHSKIPELDVLNINTVLSMNHPQGVTLYSSRSLLAACVLAPLHTECQTWKHVLHFFLLWMRWNGNTAIIACVAKDNEHVTTSHVAFILHWDFQKGQSRWKVFV